MKRGSLIGPLLIILIGAWFLVATLRPELPALEIASRFWPFLLIGWGAVRIIELLSLAARRRPLPHAGISGGEWFLVVVISLIGSGLYVATQHQPWNRLPFVRINKIEMFGQGFDFAIPEQNAPAAKAKRLLVENLRGDIRIVGGDVQDVVVAGRKAVRALNPKDADVANQSTPVEITTQADQIVIRTNQDRITGEQRITADLDITVPRALSVEIRGRSGNLEVSSVDGAVEISSDGGEVRLQDIGGNVRLDVRKADVIRAGNVKGDIEVVGGRGRDVELEGITGEVVLNGSYSGDLQFRKLARGIRIQSPQTDFRVEQIPGNLHMDLGDLVGTNLVGPIRIATNRSRDVHLEEFTEAVEIAVERGDVVLRPARVTVPKIDVRTRVGEIDLRLPAAAKFELKGTTNQGDVVNDFGPMLKTEGAGGSDDHGGSTISGRTGDGAVITLSTDRGNITIRKDEGSAEPSRPSRRQRADSELPRDIRDLAEQH